MLLVYSLLYTLAMLLMSPLFLLRRQKYASGFRERMGNYPEFKQDGRKVVWLHCVSVGETNAARPLVDQLLRNFPHCRLVVSTTTRTGQELARNVFKDKADAVFYFPFDWKFSVRRALQTFEPSSLLLMETEIWPRLLAEAKRAGAKTAIVNGRLSRRSFGRYSLVKPVVRSILRFVDRALMQNKTDADRIISLGVNPEKVTVTGNLKFDLTATGSEMDLTEQLKERFRFDGSRPLIVAASTHDPEEKWVIGALKEHLAHDARLLIAPRHPERFGAVAKLLADANLRYVLRSSPPSDDDRSADVVLLDSIGELRAVFPLAEIVFVGGSLIRHGGQSILEPALFGKAIITGPHTHNFADVVRSFVADRAVIQLPGTSQGEQLFKAFSELIENTELRSELGRNALAVMNDHRGATEKTIECLLPLLPNDR